MKNLAAPRHRRVLLLAAVIVAAGCSRDKTPAPAADSSAAGSLVAVNQFDGADGTGTGLPDNMRILNAEIVAGGIAARYHANFIDDQLQQIVELRGSQAPRPPSGDYRFYGARLIAYSGAPLRGTTPIELEFDLNGAVTKSRAGSGDVPADEISAIRARAQLLRSHALAQQSVRAHATP